MIDQKMNEAVLAGVFPGAVLLVAKNNEMVCHRPFGKTALEPNANDVTLQTVYDLASLTKPLVTAGIALVLVDRKEITLSDPVSRWIPSWEAGEKGEATVYHLLSHSSGLPAWKPLYLDLLAWQERGEGMIGSHEAGEFLFNLVHDEPLSYPVGTKSVYSDLGFILLGEILEKVGGAQLDRLASDMFLSPLAIQSLFFCPSTQRIADTFLAATEECPWRKKSLVGDVHDDHAYVMGGVAGHAGLFGTAEGVFRLASAWLKADRGEKGLFSPEEVHRFWDRSGVPGSSFALGWDTPSTPSASGKGFSPCSVGHLGYTGTSLWIDRDRGLIVVLLSNRVHPTRANEKITTFRPLIHDVIMQEWSKPAWNQ